MVVEESKAVDDFFNGLMGRLNLFINLILQYTFLSKSNFAMKINVRGFLNRKNVYTNFTYNLRIDTEQPGISQYFLMFVLT